MSAKTVGFIGLGNMGEGMASNLLAKGHPLVVMGHRRREAIDRLVARGAREVSSPAEVAAAADVVVLCVTGSPQVEEIVKGPTGILEGARVGLVVIDCSTSEPDSTVRLARLIEARGGHMVDAPMGGTPANAEGGTVQALVGGDPAVVEEVRPVIACWASAIVHLGPVGTGHRMKLINNFLSMGYASLYAEALALGESVGISHETFHSVVGHGRMQCGFYDTFMKWVLTRDENAHRFTISNADKDLTYLLSMARSVGMELPMGSAAKDHFDAFVAAGGAERYVPMLADFVAETSRSAAG
jgi:3-hydroxyisobutyrate dehydrogenase-like beta-hydroxyacid dehydrogenase